MSRKVRRQGRRTPPGLRREAPRPRLSYEQRRRRPTSWTRTWQLPVAGAAVVVVVALAAFAIWRNSQPPTPDQNALRADIAADRSGAEVTFVGTVIAAPVTVGDHEQIEVADGLGDDLELDYHIHLGQWIPVKVGDQLTVHGQLYIDPGRVGVHCLHAQTSSGCPISGWIQLAGHTYS